MVAWKGVWMGLEAIEEQKRNDAQVARADQAFQLSLDKFNLDKTTTRINTALSLSDRFGISKPVTAENRSSLTYLAKRVAGAEGAEEWLASFQSNPALATQAERLLRDKDNLKKTPEEVMTALSVAVPETSEEGESTIITYDDILDSLNSGEDVDELLADLSLNQGMAPTLMTDPSLYSYTSDMEPSELITYFQKQQTLFNNLVIDAALVQLGEMNEDIFGFDKLKEAIEKSKPGYLAPYLKSMVAPSVYSGLLSSPSPEFERINENSYFNYLRETGE